MSFIYHPPKQDYPCILYHDHLLCAVSKPAGLLSVPGKDPKHWDCMEARIQKHFPSARTIHRLDMDTSGVLLYALDPQTHRNLGLQFERRKTQKLYRAQVYGHLDQDEGEINLPLRCDWPNRPKQMVCHEQGRPAQTFWRALERTYTKLPSGKKIPTTHIELRPITGRSHQLRVHMLEIGHPILGDRFYAHKAALSAAPRLMLHAQSLTFHHPEGGRLICVEDSMSTLPKCHT